jgi:hypothetical protein
MAELFALWLPIVVASVAVFFASFLAWVVIGHHTPDWREHPDEGGLMDFLQKSGSTSGYYMFPMARTKEEMSQGVKKQRLDSGPWGTVNIFSGPVNMGRNLGLTFLFYFVTSVFIAYVGTLGLDPGAGFSKVFQMTGTVGILAYAFGPIGNAIWFGTHLRPAVMDVIDGVVFGLVTGLVFASLWPGP